MTKKPALWMLLAVLSLAAAAFSWRYFSSAFPLLSIDIGMDRQAALARARLLASERSLGPTDFRAAASFGVDQAVQTFVELEGGGKPAFAALAADPLYTPYLWRVRHFKELEKNEVTLTFAPAGTPTGFVERLREDAPGAALAPAQARTLAESTAARVWNVDLAPFQAVEQSQERRPAGRVDHTFVYERADRRLGDGRFRLRLIVSGDKLTEVTYFIKVPDAFSRRYEQMRSVNTAIGVAGSLAFILLYVGGGIAFGLFVLARQRWVDLAAAGDLGRDRLPGTDRGAHQRVAAGVDGVRHRALDRVRSWRRWRPWPSPSSSPTSCCSACRSWPPRASRAAPFRTIRSSGRCGVRSPDARRQC